uniref:nuclear GTPase SLIP-GC-like n=1 Tax=Epinephelus lanceolatus TaxID=310571 RepID=UPI001447FCA1|nr:nuclear GTPase SLIP-GC-like [Epinephelus lanceolatus]
MAPQLGWQWRGQQEPNTSCHNGHHQHRDVGGGVLHDYDSTKYFLISDEGIDTESLYCLGHEEIAALIPKVGPRAKFKKKLKLLKGEQNTTNPETVDSPAQVHPSTSASSDKVKRKLDLQGESSNWQSPTRKQRCEPRPGSYSEGFILSNVKNIMGFVQNRLPDQDNKLHQFLKKKINDLEIEKRELVGVFGKTGAGKSSLINAVIGEKNLLPIGRVKACTTVLIKVEANMLHQRYEAEIEFITKEEWKDESWSLLNFLGDNADQEDEQEDEQEGDQEDDEDQDTVDKLSALYGEEWRDKTPENLMENKYFKEIPEFLLSKRKLLTAESAKELSAKLVKYTRSESNDGEGKEVKKWYWPLVKCVTVRVPNNDLLQHVTLVDLPGNGDRNKSRDKMWKGVVGSCSTVWIVTEMKRAAAEREAWDILKSASSLIGNGGECQRIHFICTMSDDIGDTDDRSRDAVRALIFQNNMQAKEEVNKEFRKLKEFKKHFSDECFKVFTVSSKEFLKQKRLTPEETEIPKLQEFLQELNDCHSETLNYVSGAHGILSLIQGARSRAGVRSSQAECPYSEEKMKTKLNKNIRKQKKTIYKSLMETIKENMKESYEKAAEIRGGGSLKNMRSTIENHVRDSKDIMFQRAKNVMLEQLENLMVLHWIYVNGISAFVIQELSKHSGHMRPGTVLHQEEPRAQCTSEKFDNRSEDFILVPGCDMEVCVTLLKYASPDHH